MYVNISFILYKMKKKKTFQSRWSPRAGSAPTIPARIFHIQSKTLWLVLLAKEWKKKEEARSFSVCIYAVHRTPNERESSAGKTDNEHGRADIGTALAVSHYNSREWHPICGVAPLQPMFLMAKCTSDGRILHASSGWFSGGHVRTNGHYTCWCTGSQRLAGCHLDVVLYR